MKAVILHHPTDAEAAVRCRVHLSALRRQGLVELSVAPTDCLGDLPPFDMLLVLLSPDMLDWWGDAGTVKMLEAGRLLGDRRCLVPIHVRPCDLEGTVFFGLQGLPKRGLPSASYITGQDEDEAWTEVARGVREVVESIRARAPQEGSE